MQLEIRTAEDLAVERAAIAAARVRADRNRLLAASDWTQVADAPVDQGAWASYRSRLRDMTRQPGFPHDVTWPKPPP